MARPKAPCGSYSAYKRHLKNDEPVDDACRQASDERVAEQRESRKAGRPKKQTAPPPDDFGDWDDFDKERRERPETPSAGRSRSDRLHWQLGLLEDALAYVSSDDPAKLAPLSKRHSELLAEIESLTGGGAKEADPFDEFFNGDVSNVVGFPTAKDREAS